MGMHIYIHPIHIQHTTCLHIYVLPVCTVWYSATSYFYNYRSKFWSNVPSVGGGAAVAFYSLAQPVDVFCFYRSNHIHTRTVSCSFHQQTWEQVFPHCGLVHKLTTILSFFGSLFPCCASREGTGDNWTSADINNSVPPGTAVSLHCNYQLKHKINLTTWMDLFWYLTRARHINSSERLGRGKMMTHCFLLL